jgi:transcriptional regulator with XRE-family HTH domain
LLRSAVATVVNVSTVSPRPTIGPLLKSWRQRRHLSQLDLATTAGVATRHLSFVETGRSRPSREMVLHLAEHLDVPLRERNSLLLAAGYAPTYSETNLDAPAFETVRGALDRILAGHEPYPTLVIDRRWNLVAANQAAGVLIEGVAPELLGPPMNVLRASLHSDGLAPRIVNYGEWADLILSQLRRQALLSGDQELAELESELQSLATQFSGDKGRRPDEGPGALAIPMRLRTDQGELALLSTIATFGTALDITLSELAIESFLPADAETAAALQARQ